MTAREIDVVAIRGRWLVIPPPYDRNIVAALQADVLTLCAALEAARTRIRELQDACLTLWAELPMPEVKTLRDEMPRLIDFLVHLHHSIEHEQAMVRGNVWADSERSRGT